jgi:hypothetical protein
MVTENDILISLQHQVVILEVVGVDFRNDTFGRVVVMVILVVKDDLPFLLYYYCWWLTVVKDASLLRGRVVAHQEGLDVDENLVIENSSNWQNLLHAVVLLPQVDDASLDWDILPSFDAIFLLVLVLVVEIGDHDLVVIENFLNW